MFKPTAGLLVFLVLGMAAAFAEDRLASATLVLFNSNDPESAELARYYASKRSIPAAQVIGFDLPAGEEITREVFNRQIADPLRSQLIEKGCWSVRLLPDGTTRVFDTRIRFLALMRGFPLKISSDPSIERPPPREGIPPAVSGRNDASVDSELAAMGLPDFVPGGLIPNPYFGRFTPILEESVSPGLLLPSRLDAPTAAMVRKMIDDSIATEKEGLWGWAYVDGRDITKGAYIEGDHWMRKLVEILRQSGIPTIFNNLPETFQENFPITDAAVYFGWYTGDINGPFLREDFRFRPGAVAVHLHSFSASTLRSSANHWCGPLIARGASATLGNVYEPYLSFTANLDVFQDRLLAGVTLAEAGWMSQRAISWMGVVIGDPLYKPYQAWNQFSDPRGRQENPFRRFRSITRSSRSNILLAMLPIHEATMETGDSMFLEALGNAQMDAGHLPPALDSFRDALKMAKDPDVQARLKLEIAFVSRRISPEEFKEEPSEEIAPSETFAEDLEAKDKEFDLYPPKPTPTPPWDGLQNLPYPDL
jgi:uncharacterized protein (TIGR03790 family)